MIGPTFSRHQLWIGVRAAIFLLLAIGFVRLGRSTDAPDSPDFRAEAWVVAHRAEWPGLTASLRAATRLGDPPLAPLATAAAIATLGVLARRGVGGVRRTEPAAWLLAVGGGWVLSNALKAVFHRARPPLVHRLVAESNYSFPSTHSVFAAAFFTMLAIALARHLPERPRLPRVLAVAACPLLALLIGLSRIWLGVHHPTDVAGGLILGAGWACAAALLERAGFAARRGVRPDPQE